MASSYVVLARKWRPAQFTDIVGQDSIVRTLVNAVRLNRIHQAYLFTGSRGIGKTSIARIFSKVIRCEKVQEKQIDKPASDSAKWLTSCDECANCKEIAGSSSVDVIEIDGASNNGVEAVREVRENAKYLPSSGSKKIYIIDEVHMLTTAAFNALLKTLEEPPPHVIFIFATTEPHKIPATILSRCQRFDYRRVTLAQIQAKLAQITEAEKLTAEPGALALIARAAEGSMRDALSLLDQVIAFSGNQVTAESVRESISLIETQTLLGILAAVFDRKPLEALGFVEQAYQKGYDLRVLTRGLIEFLHGAILAKIGASNSGTLEISETEWKELQGIAELRSLEEIELIFQVLHQGLDGIARSSQPKIILDVLLVKCATADALVYVDSSHSPRSPAAGDRPASAPIPTPTVSPALKPSSSPAPAWEGLIGHVRKTRPLLASILEHAHCTTHPFTEWKGSKGLTISYRPEDAYFREQLQSRVYHEQLLVLAKEYLGSECRIQIELSEGGESLASRKKREASERERAAKEAAKNHPILQEAQALFGGELGSIELNDATEDHHASP